MSEEQSPAGENPPDAAVQRRRPPFLVVLAVILFLECAVLAAAVVYLLFELMVARPDSYPSAVAIVLLAAVAAVWLGVTAGGTLRGRPWIRGSAVVWQLLQIAIAVGSFQGLFARADVGWMLLVPALAALVLLFTPSVVAATTRPAR